MDAQSVNCNIDRIAIYELQLTLATILNNVIVNTHTHTHTIPIARHTGTQLTLTTGNELGEHAHRLHPAAISSSLAQISPIAFLRGLCPWDLEFSLSSIQVLRAVLELLDTQHTQEHV